VKALRKHMKVKLEAITRKDLRLTDCGKKKSEQLNRMILTILSTVIERS